MKTTRFWLTLESKHKENFVLFICKSKQEVRDIVTADFGYLPNSGMTECFFVNKSGVSTLVIRKTTLIGVLAHEVYHAVSHTAKKLGLEPTDYKIVSPDGNDFGYQPSEVLADLFHALFINVLRLQKKGT